MTIPTLTSARRALCLAALACVPTTSALAGSRLADLQAVVRSNPHNAIACVALAQAYLQEMHSTGDPSYEMRADSLATRALALDSTNAPALVVRGTIQLSRHDFAGALICGERARALAPHSADALAVVADAQIELGQDSAAVATVDRFVSERPGLASYARVSYLRELHGDRRGAIAAMQSAFVAGGTTPADAAWCAARVGFLQLGAGAVEDAMRAFDRALVLAPRCVPAFAGRARVLLARGDSSDALASLDRANAIQPMVENVALVAELQDLLGRARDAARNRALVSALLAAAHASGTDTDLDAAIFEANHTAPESADMRALVARTRAAHARRPSVMADHVLAWVLFRSGDVRGAHDAIARALRLRMDDPTVLYHAGAIALASGDSAGARTHLTRALASAAALSPRDALDARRALASLPESLP